MDTVFLGALAYLLDDPFQRSAALEIIERGAIRVGADGRIRAAGERRVVCAGLPSDSRVVDYGDAWLLPGLIDAHLHYPQYYALAAANRGLLSWLEQTVFPEEQAFSSQAYAARVADALVRRLLGGGVTTAVVYGSRFAPATAVLFDAAKRHGLRLFAGVTLMDRNGPGPLLTDPDSAWRLCETFYSRCQDEQDLHFVLTPRFALSCSPALLEMCGEFKRRFPDVYVQTHINENREEIDQVGRAFPEAQHYLDVYDQYGLLGPRTLLAHDVHPQGAELRRMAETGCVVCHCPSSNLFLGSGLFPLRRHLQHGISLALGTDIGAGLHFSVWNELSEAYKIQRLQGVGLNAAQLLYLVTLGPARALGIEDRAGTFKAGAMADFWVLDPTNDPYLCERLDRCEDAESPLFTLIQLARHHCRATCIRGRIVEQV